MGEALPCTQLYSGLASSKVGPLLLSRPVIAAAIADALGSSMRLTVAGEETETALPTGVSKVWIWIRPHVVRPPAALFPQRFQQRRLSY